MCPPVENDKRRRASDTRWPDSESLGGVAGVGRVSTAEGAGAGEGSVEHHERLAGESISAEPHKRPNLAHSRECI